MGIGAYFKFIAAYTKLISYKSAIIHFFFSNSKYSLTYCYVKLNLHLTLFRSNNCIFLKRRKAFSL